MNSVGSIRELADLDVDSLSAILGEGPAQTLWNFFHKDVRLELA